MKNCFIQSLLIQYQMVLPTVMKKTQVTWANNISHNPTRLTWHSDNAKYPLPPPPPPHTQWYLEGFTHNIDLLLFDEISCRSGWDHQHLGSHHYFQNGGGQRLKGVNKSWILWWEEKEIMQPFIEGAKNELVSNGQKQHYIIINEINIFKGFWHYTPFFFKLIKYSYVHNHSINIYIIFISLSIFPNLISNKDVNSTL